MEKGSIPIAREIIQLADQINFNIAYYYRLYVGGHISEFKSGGDFTILSTEKEINLEQLHSLVPHASEIKLTSENIKVYFVWPKKVFEDEETIADINVFEESPDTIT